MSNTVYPTSSSSSNQEKIPDAKKSKFSWSIADHHSPKEIYNWRLYLSIFIFGICGAARGYDEGNIAGTTTQVSFKHLFGLADKTKSADELANLKSNITSMVQLGSIGGAMIALYAVDKFGRVRCLQAVCVMWIVSAIIQITARSIGQLYAGRLLEGVFAIGLTTTIGPTYVSEVTPKAFRGMANSVFAGAVYLGVMLSYFANYGTALHVSNDSNMQWVLPTAMKIVLAGLILIGACLVTIESPRWYLKVGRPDDAVAALSKIRNLPADHPYVIGEITDINEQVINEKEAKSGNKFLNLLWQLVSVKSLRYRFFALAFLVQLLGQWSGANALTIYAPELFGFVGVKGVDKLKMTAVLGVVKFISAYLGAFFLIDALGRRRSLYIGITVQMVCILYFAIFLKVVPEASHTGTELHGSKLKASQGALAALYLSGAGWTIGFNVAQYLIGAEVFPLHIRSFAQSLIMIVHFANQYGNSKALPKMILSMKPYGPFFFFVGVNAVSLCWAYFFIPELKGRSLESMEEIFNLPWYLIGRKGHILCPDHSEINKIDYEDGHLHYSEKPDVEFVEMIQQDDNKSDDDDDDLESNHV